VLLLQGRFNEALRRLQATVDLGADAGDPNIRAQHLLSLGQIQASLGRTGEALATLSKIRGLETRSEPDLPMITVLVLQKQYDNARRMMDEQVRRWQDKAPPELLSRLRDSLEGNIALEEGKYAEAVKKILGSLPEESRKAPTSESLGRAYLGAGDYANAEALFTRIVQNPDRYRDPVGFLRSVIWLGQACDKQGKREAALGHYREALKWWGKPDFSLPEIEAAREGVTRLGR
jgi:tetratricopeptide (TPR) repeat protein